MSTNEMTAKVRQIKELETMAAEIAAEIETLKDQIKAEMTARNTEEMQVDVFKIRWATVQSSRFDTTAFRKAMPDLAQQFTKATASRRFTIA